MHPGAWWTGSATKSNRLKSVPFGDPGRPTSGAASLRRPHQRRDHGLQSTKAGDLALGIPKLREGAFFPPILEPRRRIGQALYAAMMEA